MGKRKKLKKQTSDLGFGVKNLDVELRRVIKYAVAKRWLEASEVLQSLSKQYPHEKKVWEYLSETSFQCGDMRLYHQACEALCSLEPNNSEWLYQLGYLYLQNLHPLLARHAFLKALDIDPHHELAAEAIQEVERLEPIEQKLLEDMDMPEAEGLAIALLHERGQVYMEQGDLVAARHAEEEVLARNPSFISTRNNLSLISWMEGDISQALSIAESVLALQSDNIHALSNIIHFLVVSGDFDSARAYGERLKFSNTDDAWDGWTKQVEGLSYLGDDSGVVEVWERAQAAQVEKSPVNALFFHLVAVALARTGDSKGAIKQWKVALKRDPNHVVAQENLNDIRKPIGEQHGAWPFTWDHWLLPSASQRLRAILNKSWSAGESGKLTAALEGLLAGDIQVLAMLPRVLERGGPQGQEFVLSSVEQFQTPGLLPLIKDFALSQNGTDGMRSRAAQLAVKAQLLPGEKVTLWLSGEWREIMLVAYEFHCEPKIWPSKRIEKLLIRALDCLEQNTEAQAIKAESLLHDAIALAPKAPELQQNLAVALLQQGRSEESYALIGEIVAHYPDYIPASASLAKRHLADGGIEAAEALLRPLLACDRIHIDDFSILVDAQINVLLAKDEKDSARSWLKIWDQANGKFQGDTAKLKFWKKRLGRLQRPKLLG